ncbi:MAG: hypothetical protein AAGG11_24250, partial [Pseudomonadota bacterium]
QGTDVLSLFPPGDVWARAYWNAEQQFLAVTAIRRVVDGICPDQDAPTQTYRFAALPTAGNQVLREGAGAQRDPETCVSEVLDASTCKVLRCEQRAGNISYADEQWVLAASEALARALYDVVPKWTLASMGMGDPTKIRRGRTARTSGFDEVDYDRRFRQTIDDYLWERFWEN